MKVKECLGKHRSYAPFAFATERVGAVCQSVYGRCPVAAFSDTVTETAAASASF